MRFTPNFQITFLPFTLHLSLLLSVSIAVYGQSLFVFFRQGVSLKIRKHSAKIRDFVAMI